MPPDRAVTNPKASWPGLAGLTLFIAAVYFATGYVGQLLAIQPGNVTMVWPPSGIALAAVLVAGWRAVPGIVIGAVAVNGQAFFDTSSVTSALATGSAAIVIGAGSALQPLAAAALFRRFGLVGNYLSGAASIAASIAVVATACLISATVGVAAMTTIGLISGSEAVRAWSIWWLGDQIGILLFAPVALAIARRDLATIALLALVLSVGIGGTYFASTGIRTEAGAAWDNSADREAGRLTATLQQWIESSLTSVHAMAMLFQSSGHVSEDEFWDAVTLLEENQQDFFPASLVAALPTDRGDGEIWAVVHSIEDQGRLAIGANLTAEPALEQALAAALQASGQTVIGSVYRDEFGSAWLVPAVALERDGNRHVVLGLVDLTQMVDGLFKTQVPSGIQVRISARAGGQELEDAIALHGPGEASRDTVVTKTIRGVAAGAGFTFMWDVTSRFQGGKVSELSDIVLVGGIFATALLSLFINFLLRQNRQTRQLVEERTAELAERGAELRLALDNMPGGMILTGKDLRIRLHNTDIGRFLRIPEAIVEIGAPHEKLVRYLVENGYFPDGNGDVETMVAERMDGLRHPQDQATLIHTPDGRILEIRRRRTAEGDIVSISTDVTERVKGEETAVRLREAIEGFTDSIILYDKDEQVVFTNDRYHELYPNSPPKDEIVGYTQEQLLRRSLEAGLIGDPLANSDPETWLAGRLEERRNNRTFSGETVHSSGRTLMIRHRPTSDGGLIVSHTDITERKRAEDEAKHRSVQLRSTVDSMPDGILLLDDNLDINTSNSLWGKLFELPEELTQEGKNIAGVVRFMAERGEFGDGQTDDLIEEKVEAFRATEPYLFERKLTHSGRIVTIRGNPVPGTGFVFSYTDITDRTRAEEEAELRSIQLRGTVDAMPDGILLLDENQEIITFNNLYREYFDLPEELAQVGRNVSVVFRYQAERGDFGAGGTDDFVEERLRTFRSAEPFMYERELATGRIVTIRGNPVPGTGLVVTYTDITARKHAEKEIARKEAQLRIAMQNMPGGMFMMDKDLNIQVSNDRYVEIYGMPPDAIREGGSIRSPLRFRAERGDYGPGDVDDLVEQRVARYSRQVAEKLEERLPNGRVVEYVRQPTDDGGSVAVVTDITERKQAEAALRQSEERYALAMEGAGEGLWDWDIGTDKLHVSPRFLEIMGLDTDELAISPVDWVERMHPDDHKRYRDDLTAHLRGDTDVLATEVRVQDADEGHRWVRPCGLAMRDSEGLAYRMAGSLSDITERKQSEAALRESEERVRTLVENMRGIAYRCLLDSAWTMTYIGGAVEEITGYPRSDFQDNAVRTFGDILHPDDADRVTREVVEAVAAHRDFTLEYRIRHSDGSYRWIMSVGQPILGPDGELKWLDGTLFDITERKLAEERFRSLLESAPDATVIVNAEGTIVQTNQQSEKLFGYTTEELLGQKVEIIIPERFRRGHPAHRNNYFAEARVRPMGAGLELFGQAKDGHEFPIEISLSPIETEEGTLVSAAVRDITERKKAEEELTQAHSFITESLRYASRIQRSLLPPRALLDEAFADHAIIWEPKDVVGGDMAWLRPAHSGSYLVVADCTGHGAPGAFMTMICTGALDQALAEMTAADPAEVLQRMNVTIKSALGQDRREGESDDGVELGICYMDPEGRQITFAGARFSLVVVQDGNLEEIKGNRSAIGYRHVPGDAMFTNHRRPVEEGMQFYLWTDGMIDQIGGPKRLSFGKRRLRRSLMECHGLEMERQKTEILAAFEAYQKAEVRRDDITFVGFVPKHR